MHGAIQLSRIAGVQVSADWSLALMFVLIALHLATDVFQARHPAWTPAIAWLAAFGAAVLFFASVLVRELTQAIIARRGGADVYGVTLFGFGGIPYTGLEPTAPAMELRMAIAGPIVSLLVGMSCFVVASAESTAGSTILVSVGWMNIGLCAINLLPGYPLDGGRALRALMWTSTSDFHRATWIACRMGQAIGWTAILCGMILCFGVSVPVLGRATSAGPWLMLGGWLLHRAAVRSHRNTLIVDVYRGLVALEVLADVAVTNLMRDVPARMHPRDAVRDLDGRVPAAAEQPLPIEADGVFLGWVRREDLAGFELRDLGGLRLAELMIPANCVPTIRPEQTVAEAVVLMNQCCLDHVAVVRHRRLLGMLSREDVITWVCRGG